MELQVKSPSIYFVRHGQSVANATGLVAGSSDSPLTEAGIAQAQAEAETIAQQSLQFDKIIASPLSRALNTARIITQRIGFDKDAIITSDLLCERRLGSFEGRSRKELEAAPEAELEAAGCEKLTALYERVEEANRFITKQAEGCTNVLVVGHGGFYRMARCVAEGRKPEETYTLEDPRNSTLLEYPL